MTQSVLSAIARVALALWIGAVAAVGLVVAPRVFGFLDDRKAAGDLMVPIFARVDYFGIGAAVLFVAAARKSWWRAILAGLMGACAAVSAFALAPEIAARTDNLDRYHRLATTLWTGILAAGLVLVVVGPTRRASREGAAS